MYFAGNEDFYYADGRAAGVQRAGSAMHWGVGRPENRFNLTIGEMYVYIFMFIVV